MALSINTTTTTMFSEDEFSPLPVNSGSSVIGVGLSNPQLSQGRRRMLDLVNRLQTTGLAFFLPLSIFFFVCSSTSTVSRLTLTFLKLPSSANRVLGSHRSLKLSLVSPCLGRQGLVLGKPSL